MSLVGRRGMGCVMGFVSGRSLTHIHPSDRSGIGFRLRDDKGHRPEAMPAAFLFAGSFATDSRSEGGQAAAPPGDDVKPDLMVPAVVRRSATLWRLPSRPTSAKQRGDDPALGIRTKAAPSGSLR